MPKGALLDWMILSRIPLIVVGGSDLRSVSFKLANRGDVFGEHHFLFNMLLHLLSALPLGGEDINRKYCSTNAALQFAGVVPSLSLSRISHILGRYFSLHFSPVPRKVMVAGRREAAVV